LDYQGPLVDLQAPGATITNAIHAYASIEPISLAAAETKNLRMAIPMAAKKNPAQGYSPFMSCQFHGGTGRAIE